MATVSTPPTLSSVVSVFGGPGNLTAYVRGGSQVPNISQNAAISTTAASLALSQFAGATNYTPISNVQHAAYNANKQGLTIKSVVSTPLTDPTWSGGNPSPTITWSIVTGSAVVTGGQLTTSVAIQSGSSMNGTIKVTVSDGVSSASVTVTYSLSYTQTQ